MTRFWSYILLFCFAVIATPKTLYHHHDVHRVYKKDHIPTFNDDNCFVCDFDYTSFAAPLAAGVKLSFQKLFTKISQSTYACIYKQAVIAGMRGPPSAC